jgi:hypothetical protein
MKLLKNLLLMASFAPLLVACNKKDDPGIQDTKSEAKPLHDTRSGGVYKGVIVGTSGVLKIDVANHSHTLFAVVDCGNFKDTLFSQMSYTVGSALEDVYFSAAGAHLFFSVGADGSNPRADLSITDFPHLDVLLEKETSVQPVITYLGTFTGDANGMVHFLVKSQTCQGIALSTNDNQKYQLKGKFQQNKLETDTTIAYGLVYTGSQSESQLQGSWKDIHDLKKGNWQATRTVDK